LKYSRFHGIKSLCTLVHTPNVSYVRARARARARVCVLQRQYITQIMQTIKGNFAFVEIELQK